jgi:flagellar biosynthesis/type III secretory pathway chaperone
MDVQSLIRLIEQEKKVHEKILVAKREERKLIFSMNATGLLEHTQYLSELVNDAHTLEEKRQILTATLARHYGLEKENPTLKELLVILPPMNRAELETIRESFRRTVMQLQEENTTNALAMRRSTETISKELHSLARSTESGVYTPGGKKAKGHAARAGLNMTA